MTTIPLADAKARLSAVPDEVRDTHERVVITLLDLGDAAFGDAHALGDLLLDQAPGAAYLGQTVPDDGGKQFLLAGLDGLLATGALDVLGADVALPRVAVHG